MQITVLLKCCTVHTTWTWTIHIIWCAILRKEKYKEQNIQHFNNYSITGLVFLRCALSSAQSATVICCDIHKDSIHVTWILQSLPLSLFH